jgi:hypothetical protein
MKSLTLNCLVLSVLIGCSHSPNSINSAKTQSDIFIIDLDSALNYISDAPYKFSDFTDTIIYISLETTSESVFGRRHGSSFMVTPEFIYADLKKFDRTNGKYLCSIGKLGRGPGEYLLSLSAATDITDDRVFVYDNWKDLFIYDKMNSFIKNIDFPDEFGDIKYLGTNNLILFRTSIVDLHKAEVPFEFQIYNLVEDSIINQRRMRGISEVLDNSKVIQNVFGLGRNCSWYYDKKVQYYESQTDSIFSVEKDGKLIPRFYVKRKNHKPPLEVSVDNETFEKNRSKYVEVTSIFETPRFMFIYFIIVSKPYPVSYIARFDKLSNKTNVVPIIGAFENDISTIKVSYLSNIQDSNEGLTYLNSTKWNSEFITLMENTPQSNWTNSSKQLYNLLKSTLPEDNGILCIFKFKD